MPGRIARRAGFRELTQGREGRVGLVDPRLRPPRLADRRARVSLEEAVGAALGSAPAPTLPAPLPVKILIRAPNWLGDLLMSTAFIQEVLERFPEARVDVIVRAGQEVLPVPHRGRLLAFDKRNETAGSFGNGLRKEGYDRVYVLPSGFSAAWMAFRAGVRERFGLAGNHRGWLLKPAVKLPWERRTRHLVDEYAQLIEPGRAGGAAARPHLAADPAWVAEQLAPLGVDLPERFVALAPGAAYGPAKQWPVAHFAELARLVLERTDLDVVVCGTPAESEAAAEIAAGAAEFEERVHDLCGRTDLAQLAALLARAAGVVSNDSGAMHLAAALGRPQVGLFGSTSAVWTSPVNPRAEVLDLRLDCAPCYARECPLGHTHCLEEIAPESAYAALDRVLAQA